MFASDIYIINITIIYYYSYIYLSSDKYGRKLVISRYLVMEYDTYNNITYIFKFMTEVYTF